MAVHDRGAMRLMILNRRTRYWASFAVALPLLVMIVSGLLLQAKKHWAWVQPPEIRGTGSGSPGDSFLEPLATRVDGPSGVQVLRAGPRRAALHAPLLQSGKPAHLSALLTPLEHRGEGTDLEEILLERTDHWSAQKWAEALNHRRRIAPQLMASDAPIRTAIARLIGRGLGPPRTRYTWSRRTRSR
jgi:hypothetical protein